MNKDIEQLSKDLATFKNPPSEDIPKLLSDAIVSGVESVKIVTEEMIKVISGDIEL